MLVGVPTLLLSFVADHKVFRSFENARLPLLHGIAACNRIVTGVRFSTSDEIYIYIFFIEQLGTCLVPFGIPTLTYFKKRRGIRRFILLQTPLSQ